MLRDQDAVEVQRDLAIWLLRDSSRATINARLPKHAQPSERRRYLRGERMGVCDVWVESQFEAGLGLGVKEACVAQGGQSDTV